MAKQLRYPGKTSFCNYYVIERASIIHNHRNEDSEVLNQMLKLVVHFTQNSTVGIPSLHIPKKLIHLAS